MAVLCYVYVSFLLAIFINLNAANSIYLSSLLLNTSDKLILQAN